MVSWSAWGLRIAYLGVMQSAVSCLGGTDAVQARFSGHQGPQVGLTTASGRPAPRGSWGGPLTAGQWLASWPNLLTRPTLLLMAGVGWGGDGRRELLLVPGNRACVSCTTGQ